GFFFSSRRRHTRFSRDWSSDVCSSDLRRWPWIVGVVVAFLLGVAVGGAGESASSAPAYEPAPTTVESADLPPSLVEQAPPAAPERSEERRVGKECRSRRSADR